MKDRWIGILVLCIVMHVQLSAYAADTLKQPVDTATSVEKGGFIDRLLKYFDDSNKQKENKRFDFSIIGGPHFASDTKLGLGMVAAGMYRRDLTDTITMPSNVSLYGDVSTVGFYMVGIRGNHILRYNRRRLDYDVYFFSFPTKVWGIGYGNGYKRSNETKYKELMIRLSANYLIRIADKLYIGPGGEFTHVNANDVNDATLWEGQRLTTTSVTAGLRLQYDSRDNLTAPSSGWLAWVDMKSSPKFLANRMAFSHTEINVATYVPVWTGGVAAWRAHGKFCFGDVPWSMLATFGGSHSMRGYYEGRYRDKCEYDVTMELRQNIWGRVGAVAWAGVGSVAPKIDRFTSKHILTNFGIGYRWEFKKNCNVRLDFGIGRGESSFIFNINEAF